MALPSDLSECPPLDTVVSAIHTLSGLPTVGPAGDTTANNDPRRQEEAAKWLQLLQKSVHAWKVSDALLHQRRDYQTCYIAAQTLRTKVAYSFHELPQEAIVSLKASLLEHVANIDESTNAVIVTQLCLALTDLLLQVPDWQNSVSELLQLYGSTRPFALLEILTVLPEEAHSRTLNLGSNRRTDALTEMQQCTDAVLQFLCAVLAEKCSAQQPPTTVQQYKLALLRCLKSWLTVHACPPAEAQKYPIVSYPFQILADLNESQTIHEAAADAVCNLCETFEDIEERLHGPLEESVYNAVKKLEMETFPQCVNNEDIVKAINLTRVFTVYCESYYLKMTSREPNDPHFSMGMLSAVVKCCVHPDYEVPDITVNLWYLISESLYHSNSETKTAMYQPYITGLIDALRVHCQMEPDYHGILEEREDFTEFRARATELIKDVVFIIGSTNIFRSMMPHVVNYHSLSWETTESALFLLSAVARNMDPNDNEFIPTVLNFILSLDKSAQGGNNTCNGTTNNCTVHVAIRHTGMKIMGELGEWIYRHPEYLERILNWLLGGLHEEKLASDAATALQNICSQCQDHMKPHFPGLVSILQSLDSFKLTPAAANGLIKGVALILCEMPHEFIEQNMKGLCALMTDPLSSIIEQHAASGQQQTLSRNSAGDPVLYLDRLASVFRYVTPQRINGVPHPCLPAITELAWPVISRAMGTWQADVRVSERACRCVRFAVRCVNEQAAPILEPLVSQMVLVYAAHPHSCFLYLGSILVDEFCQIAGCIEGLLSMLEAFLPTTYRVLQADGGLKNHPDTVDDFFRLNARFLQRCGVPYLQTSYLPGIVDCALLSATLDHRDANASTLKFFFDLLHAGRTKEDRPDFEARKGIITQIKDLYGAKLIDTLIKGAVTNLPSYTFMDIGDIVYELMLFERTVVCHWLEATLKDLPETNASGIPTVTKKQLVTFHKEVTSAEDPKAVSDAVRQFSRLWR